MPDENKQMYLDQYINIQNTLVKGIKKTREGLLDVWSAIQGINLMGPQFLEYDKAELDACDELVRVVGTVALGVLAHNGKLRGLPDGVTDTDQPIDEFMSVHSVTGP